MDEDVGEAGCEPAPARLANGRFGPGNPGRRPGSRNKLTQRLVTAILADFERNRETVLRRLRDDHAVAYARLVARFLPPGALAGESETPETPAPFAELAAEVVGEALERLDQMTWDDGWAPLTSTEEWLLRETRWVRLEQELKAAKAALAGDADRNNGESTVAEADSALAEAVGPAPER